MKPNGPWVGVDSRGGLSSLWASSSLNAETSVAAFLLLSAFANSQLFAQDDSDSGTTDFSQMALVLRYSISKGFCMAATNDVSG